MDEVLNSVIDELSKEVAKEKTLKYLILVEKDREIAELKNQNSELIKQIDDLTRPEGEKENV